MGPKSTAPPSPDQPADPVAATEAALHAIRTVDDLSDWDDDQVQCRDLADAAFTCADLALDPPPGPLG